VLGHTLSPVRQLFERIASPSAAADAESRFQHFKKHVWLRIKESGSSGDNYHYLYKQESGAALLDCAALRCRLPCCWSLLGFAGWLSQSSPCKHAVNAAYDKEAMFTPVAFSISTSFLASNGKRQAHTRVAVQGSLSLCAPILTLYGCGTS
jgi:hypothetical protein